MQPVSVFTEGAIGFPAVFAIYRYWSGIYHLRGKVVFYGYHDILWLLMDLHTQESVAKAEGMSKQKLVCVQVIQPRNDTVSDRPITPRLTNTHKQVPTRCGSRETDTATESGRTVAACNLAGSRGV